MARSQCTCGSQILWKADEPQSDEYFLIAKNKLPDPLLIQSLHDAAHHAAVCSVCGRIWVEHTGDVTELLEYVPQDHTRSPNLLQ